MLSVHFLGEVFLKTNKAEEHPMACAFQWVQTLRFSPSLSLGSEWPTPMCQEARFQACMPTQTGDPLLSVPFWKTMSIRQAWSVCQCKTLRNKLVWLLLTGCNSHGAQSVLPINLSSGVFRCLPKHPLDKNFWVKLYFLAFSSHSSFTFPHCPNKCLPVIYSLHSDLVSGLHVRAMQ